MGWGHCSMQSSVRRVRSFEIDLGKHPLDANPAARFRAAAPIFVEVEFQRMAQFAFYFPAQWVFLPSHPSMVSPVPALVTSRSSSSLKGRMERVWIPTVLSSHWEADRWGHWRFRRGFCVTPRSVDARCSSTLAEIAVPITRRGRVVH